MKVLVVGGSGGIGLAIVKAFLERNDVVSVVATYHAGERAFCHENLQWVSLDVQDEVAIQTLASEIGDLDVLVNAVGYLHSPGAMPEKTIKEFDVSQFERNIALNTLPSILLAKHFMNSLKSNSSTFFITLSARVGSIEDNRVGGWVSYRASKAALNMAIKTISIEWQHKLPNCCVLLFHPGTTDTLLSKPFQKGLPEGQLHSAEYVAESLLTLLEGMDSMDTGRFVSFDGGSVPW